MQYAGLTLSPQCKTVVFMKKDASLKARRPFCVSWIFRYQNQPHSGRINRPLFGF